MIINHSSRVHITFKEKSLYALYRRKYNWIVRGKNG